jgi:hypothetical protein
MERWSDILGYEPQEKTEPKPEIPSGPVTKCCNCGNDVEITQKWSKCEGCGYYINESFINRHRNN